MTESIKESQEAEILSQLIDELNAGQQPESDDPETAELLAIAALIKKTGPVVRPPQHLLDQTVDKILAEPFKKPKKFWSWMNPGVLGAAASLLLVAGLQLYPSWNSSEVQTVTAPAAVMEKRETVPEKQVTGKMATASTAYVSEEALPVAVPEKTAERAQETALSSPSPVTPLAANPVSETVIQPLTGPAAIAAPETAQKAPVLNEQALLVNEKTFIMSERAAIINKSGSSYKAAAFMIDDPADRWPLPILSLPGQTPDEISSDKKTGTVRQVFWKRTPQEVIVTQRMLRQEERTEKPSSLAGSIENKAGTVNSVTVILHNQEVTVEGCRTEQELLKVVKQLTL